MPYLALVKTSVIALSIQTVLVNPPLRAIGPRLTATDIAEIERLAAIDNRQPWLLVGQRGLLRSNPAAELTPDPQDLIATHVQGQWPIGRLVRRAHDEADVELLEREHAGQRVVLRHVQGNWTVVSLSRWIAG